VITAPQLKETLTPAKFDGAMFKHLTIANNTHTPVIGKACHWSTNNFHLFSVILLNLSMKHQMELFPRLSCTEEASRCVLYALHLQKFQSYSLEAMNHHDSRRVSEK